VRDGIYTIGINLPGVLNGDDSVVLTTLAARTVRQLVLLLVPISLAYSSCVTGCGTSISLSTERWYTGR
jgi:hypothetical protein